MLRVGGVLALTALCLAVSGCGRAPQKAAEPDVRGFLAAVQAQDAAAFEKAVDRPALRRDLAGQMQAIGAREGVVVDGGPSAAALDRMIGPDNLHLTDAAGAPLSGPPSAAQAQAMTRALDKTHVCLTGAAPPKACVLTFAKETAGWRLVRMPASAVTLAVPPEPKSK